MKDTEAIKLVEFSNDNGVLVPMNDNANQLIESLGFGEVISLKVVSNRDLKFHKCYMSLLGYVYDFLPDKFKRNVSKNDFYNWLKVLRGDYEIKYKFHDGKELIEYTSISFAKMDQKEFEIYIKNQLPWIYENVIGAFYSGEEYKMILENIETEFERFLSKL